MSLVVLSVSFPLAPVEPDSIGGAEQILNEIDRALVAAGHRSIVIAPENSVTAGELAPIPRIEGPLDDHAKALGQEHMRQAIARVLAAEGVDVVHLHGIDFYAYLPAEPVPVLATLHVPPEWYPPEVFTLTRPHTYLNCVSESQRRRCPDSSAFVAPIPNGVAVERFSTTEPKQNFALALGRICPEKGFHLAIDAATRVGVSLYIGGRVYPYEDHVRYYQREIVPRIALDGHRFLGPVRGDEKRRLLARARCVVIPSLVPETSSLVAMEALSAGTPVVAFSNGALPDIVEHGRTGFLVNSVEELGDAIRDAVRLDPAECRRAARERFSVERMTSRYIETYRELAQASTAVPRMPAADLESLRADWESLFRRCRHATPFQHPAWLLPWWRRWGHPPDLSLVTLRREGRLVGLAPLRWWNGKRILIGTGISDYNNVLVEPGFERDLLEAIDGPVFFEDVPENSPLRGLNGAAETPCSRCPRASLQATKLSSKLLKNLRYCGRKLDQLGDCRIEAASLGNLDEFLDTLFRCHGARWRTRGEHGVLADRTLQSFHREAARGLAEAGMLRLYGLRLNHRLCGALYGFAANGRVFYYLSGFDPDLAAYSPGSLLIRYAWQDGQRRGDSEIDFLRGSEPYKYAWGTRDHWTYTITR